MFVGELCDKSPHCAAAPVVQAARNDIALMILLTSCSTAFSRMRTLRGAVLSMPQVGHDPPPAFISVEPTSSLKIDPR